MAPATLEATQMVEFVSPHANLWVSLATAVEHYTTTGHRITETPTRKVQFTKGRAMVSPEMAAEMEAHRECGVKFWRADDIMAPFVGDTSPRVTSGQAHSRTRQQQAPSAPPLANWDQMGANAIKEAIKAGRVPNLQDALLYEATHRGRGQVVMAVNDALKAGRGPEDDEPEAAEPTAQEGFVRPVPPDARGL